MNYKNFRILKGADFQRETAPMFPIFKIFQTKNFLLFRFPPKEHYLNYNAKM